MIKFYAKLIGGYKIKKYKKQWELYQLGSRYVCNWHLIGLIILSVLYFLFPSFSTYIIIPTAILALSLLLKFGEYKGYNECLHEVGDEEMEDE